MKRLFRIDESEKNRILGMHKSATTRQYLKEQEGDATDQADAGEETSQETTTDQTSSQETYDCGEVDEYLKDEGVKKWIKAIKDNKSEIMKGSEQNEKNPVYKGVKKVIAIIQCKLKELNLNPGTIDGIFGNNTKKAVEAFQMKEFNKKDGIVGDETWTKMFPDESSEVESENDNVDEIKQCLDQFTDSSANSEVEGGIPKEIQGINYVFFDNNRFAILNSTPGVKGNWKCEENKVMTKVTAPYRGPWVVLIP